MTNITGVFKLMPPLTHLCGARQRPRGGTAQAANVFLTARFLLAVSIDLAARGN
jgi:hypothetical protein